MFPAPIQARAAVVSTAMRWGVSLASVGSATLAFAAFAGDNPLAFLGVFVADILIAALATLASELALNPGVPDPKPSPEDLAIFACLHCGVLAMLLISTPSGLPGVALLTLHQALLAVNVRRLPAG